MGGSNEFVECLGGCVVAEGGSGAVARDFPISDVGRFNQSIASQQWWDNPASNPAMIAA